MGELSREGSYGNWPSAGALLLCIALLVAGYVVAILRGPMPAHEVRVVMAPSPTPTPEPPPVAE